MLPAETEDLSKVIHMRGHFLTDDEDVVHIDLQELDPLGVETYYRRSSNQRACAKFVHPKGVDDGGLLNVFWSHRDLIITPQKVEFGENCRSSNSQGKIRNIQKRVAIRVSDNHGYQVSMGIRYL